MAENHNRDTLEVVDIQANPKYKTLPSKNIYQKDKNSPGLPYILNNLKDEVILIWSVILIWLINIYMNNDKNSLGLPLYKQTYQKA